MENINSSTQNVSPSTSPSITVTQPTLTIEPRDLVIAVLLTFVTFGFYALYWQYKLTNEIHALSGKPKTASGGRAVFYTIITLTIYGYYWLYKIGKELSDLRVSHGLEPDSISNQTYNRVLWIVTGLGIGWGILCSAVNYMSGIVGMAAEHSSDGEVFAFTFFAFIAVIFGIVLHLLVAVILSLYVYKRDMKDPSTLYVLFACFRTQVFSLAFPQHSLNDYLRSVASSVDVNINVNVDVNMV